MIVKLTIEKKQRACKTRGDSCGTIELIVILYAEILLIAAGDQREWFFVLALTPQSMAAPNGTARAMASAAGTMATG